MLVLITYDVSTEDTKGKGRLRKVAKQCVNYGQRVQNSVFECVLDPGQCKLLKAQLLKIIDLDKDSLRFYYLGNQYKSKIEHYGTKRCQKTDSNQNHKANGQKHDKGCSFCIHNRTNPFFYSIFTEFLLIYTLLYSW